MIGHRIKINLVAFLVLSLGLSYAMATQVLSVLQDRMSVFVELEDAGGVFTSQEVTYRGITVGQVGKMEVTEDGVRIALEIDEGTLIPKDDIEARVMFKSAVGEQFVDLLPAADGPPYLQDKDTIPQDQTSIPVSTQDLLTTLEAVLRGVPPEALKGAVDALGIGLTGRGPDIATIIESAATLAEVFAERAEEFEGILKSGTKVGGAFLESKEEFAAAIRELVTVSQSLSDSRANLERLMRGGNLTSREVVRLLREHNKGVNDFVREFAEVNELQAEHADDISQLLRFLPAGLLGVVNTFESETGLVRFSLVTDPEAPACSYGTSRRPPSDRSTGLPPKGARCSDNAAASDAPTGSSSDRDPSGDAVTEGVLPNLGESLGTEGPVLPQRMAEWSWTLFYLNAI